MKTILKFLKDLYSGPFQGALVLSFTLVAAVTIGVGTWVISNTITSYLAEAMNERIEQDMLTAQIFYQFQMEELVKSANQLALSKTVNISFENALAGDPGEIRDLEDKIQTALSDGMLKGNRVAVILDAQGNVIAGVLRSIDRRLTLLEGTQSWGDFPVFLHIVTEGSVISSTEVIPKEILEDTCLADQALIDLLETPKAAPELFDSREVSAGLGIVGAAPIRMDGHVAGVVLIFHLFNNDFALVDDIRDTAKIDTVTIFLGDLRVSTNVMTEDGKRAVGTRVSQEVSDVVLQKGMGYVGSAFVVNENYITHYEPLRNHQDQVVGILYVGARQAAFQNFLNIFRSRISFVAATTTLLTFLLATPVSRIITRPLKDLRTLSQTSQLVGEGNLEARAPTTARGEVGLLAASFNDMLDRLQDTQKQLVQSEKLASLGQLAAGVAHELNNPLATVLLFAEALLREQSYDGGFQKDLKTIVRETKRCKTIVTSLLDFARQHQVDVAEVNLNKLIEQVISLEKNHPRYESVRIKTLLDPDLPFIQADEVQLQAVIRNLISNAADAMPEGGELTLETHQKEPDQVAIEVIDEGGGISPENQAKIFTPFYTTKAPGKGTGLGLSIVYGIVKMHRGQIGVQSDIGKGTKFIIQLPIRQQDRRPPEKTDYSTPKRETSNNQERM
jgi:two-component system NtrC family sensor kinase